LAGQRVENQALKDEIARLKKLPPRPPQKPSGMEKATDRPEGGTKGGEDEASRRRRGPGVSKLKTDRTIILTVEAPAGSRHKGYENIVVQDLMLKAETTLYRRECWETPDGKRLMAPLDGGIVGGCGPHLHRLVLMLEKGREARDAMLGLAKTCKKLKIPFFDYLGARLGIPGPDIPDLATLVRPAPS